MEVAMLTLTHYILGTLLFLSRITSGEATNNRTKREMCLENEYPYKGRCCIKCPKGTYVTDHCIVNHRQGICERCFSGEDFTEYPNGMDHCIGCKHCRTESDEVLVKACTETTDAICQCKPGKYCTPGQACEACTNCSRCGPGQRIIKECTATSDTVCENEMPSTTKAQNDSSNEEKRTQRDTIIAVVIPVALVALLLFCIGVALYRRKNGKMKSGGSDVESKPLQHGDSNITVQSETTSETRTCEEPEFEPTKINDPVDLMQVVSQKSSAENVPLLSASVPQPTPKPGDSACANSKPSSGLPQVVPITTDNYTNCFYTFIDEVPHKSWKEFMRRIQLDDNEIENISIPNNIKEEKYQMLCIWRFKKGSDATVNSLLCVLDEMNLGGCKENVINALKDKGILPCSASQ